MALVGALVEAGVMVNKWRMSRPQQRTRSSVTKNSGLLARQGRQGREQLSKERHEQWRAVDGGVREPKRSVGVGGPPSNTVRP